MKRIISLMVSLVCALICFSATALAAPETSAKAVAVLNAETGEVLYEQNGHERLPEASITKVMTLLLVFEALDSGQITLEDKVTCSEHAASMGGSQIWLEVGEQMTVHELLKATAVGSANDAAVALAEHVAGSHEAFVALMNDKARELNMNETSYKNCTGLDSEGHLTSAIDVGIVSAELLRHELTTEYTTIWMDTLRNGELQLANTNKLLKQYQGINGLKTGTTSQAGCCVTASAKRDDMTIIAVVMGAPNSKARFSEAKKLLDYGFDNWEIVNAADFLPVLSEIKVEGGVEGELKVSCDISGSIVVPKGQKELITAETTLQESVSAPVEPGQTVGSVILKAGENKLNEYPVVTCRGTEAISFGKVFEILFRQLTRLG